MRTHRPNSGRRILADDEVDNEEPPRMATTGFLLTLALALGADPAAPDPYGSLRESVRRQDDEPAEFSPFVQQAGGWSVSDAPAAPVAAEGGPAANAQAGGNRQPVPVERAPRFQPPPDAAVPSDGAGSEHALKLTPPTKTSRSDAAPKSPSATGAITSIVSSLALVLGLFFVVVWFARRSAPKGASVVPGEVLEVLGRAALTPRQQMHVVRFGNKLVLLSLSPSGAEPLAEIDDPVEVERVLGICQEMQQGSITETFRQVFSQFGNEPAQEGFAGREGAGRALREG
jgi:flagellar biogenesis protein FliO